MKSNKFFCSKCGKYFDELKIYEERHGFEHPPYERVSVCPLCNGDDYYTFNSYVEKIDIAEKILPIIMRLNRFHNILKKIFGKNISNNDLSDCMEMLVEVIVEMFDFLEVNMQKRILNMDENNEVEKILRYLKGGL